MSIITVFLLLLASGCQNAGQRDLVLRELRMQEDQLYAMENYLSEYQQLVCKYRSENAALRRELAEVRDDGELPSPTDGSQGSPAPRDGPALDTPQSTPRRELDAEPTPREIEAPEVPPLEMGSNASPPPIDLALYVGGAGESAVAASHATITVPTSNEPAIEDSDDVSTADTIPLPVTHRDRERGAGLQNVWLHGEVLLNEDHGGPRLVVDVETFDRSGTAVPFEGTLSLMLLMPEGDEEPHSLARWDFSAEDVQAAADPADASTLRFYLELPAETECIEPAEIWARLMPPGKGKLLTHAEINLAEPGKFSSSVEGTGVLSRDDVSQAVGAKNSSNETPQTTSRLVAEGWAIARPDGVVQAQGPASSEWRASSEPIPVVQDSTPPAGHAVNPIHETGTGETAGAELPPRYKRPTWTPDRPSSTVVVPKTATTASGSHRQRPAWLATR